MVAARAVASQLVSESGYFTFTVAAPFVSVFTSGSQRMVERKSLRTWTAGSGASGVDAGGAAAGLFIRRPFIDLSAAATPSTTTAFSDITVVRVTSSPN